MKQKFIYIIIRVQTGFFFLRTTKEISLRVLLLLHLALTKNLNETPLVSEAARWDLKRFLYSTADDNDVLM